MGQPLQQCTQCVLPASFPNISFDAQGVCNFCQRHNAIDRTKFDLAQKQDFDDVLKRCKGKYAFDAICCYSGGKDSTYMLKMMTQEYGLKVLAYTLDNGFITDQSKTNITKIVETLGVDHVFYKPSAAFMGAMYRSAMFGDLNKGRGNYKTRISDACLACISLVNTHAARLALQMKIPMIFSGFTPGQIPKAVIKNNYKYYQETYEGQKEHFKATLGPDAARYFELSEPDFEIFQISPFLVHEVSEEKILSEIRSLGWVYPENLDGCSSNCALNAVGNICHEKRYGFHPYASELSQLVRQKLLSREEAQKKLSQNVDAKSLDATLSKLGLTRAEFERAQASGSAR